MKLAKAEQKELLSIARNAIIDSNYFSDKSIVNFRAGVFVSVYVNDDLRGCIGNLNPDNVTKQIIKNARLAAFSDNRFIPISKEEFAEMKIHINLLSEPIPMHVKDEKDLLKKLNKKPGLVIRKGFHSATFLPSVWLQLPDKIDFLDHLCLKAGLSPDEWKREGMNFEEYSSFEFSE